MSEIEQIVNESPKTLKDVINDALEALPQKQILKVQFVPHRTAFMNSMVETLYFDGDGKSVSPEHFLKDLFIKLPDFLLTRKRYVIFGPIKILVIS